MVRTSLARDLAVVGELLAAVLADSRDDAPADGEARDEDDVLVEHDAGLQPVPVGTAHLGGVGDVFGQDRLRARPVLRRLQLRPRRWSQEAARLLAVLRRDRPLEVESRTGGGRR